MTKRLCSWCEQPLIETDFNREFFLYLCDNNQCRRFRQPQGTRRKYPEPEVQGRRKETELPSYPATRARARANYRTARLLGIECREAVDYRSNKRLNELLERVKHPSAVCATVNTMSDAAMSCDDAVGAAKRSGKRTGENG